MVLHPLHPVELIPVVEVVPGEATSPLAVARAAQLLRAFGKRPVVLRQEVTGYVINRLVAAWWREAIELVRRGYVDVAGLDEAVSGGPCLGWAVQGPFLTYELAASGGVGTFLAHLGPAFERLWDRLASWERLPDGVAESIAKQTAQAYGEMDRAGLENVRDTTLAQLVHLLYGEAVSPSAQIKSGVMHPSNSVT